MLVLVPPAQHSLLLVPPVQHSQLSSNLNHPLLESARSITSMMSAPALMDDRQRRDLLQVQREREVLTREQRELNLQIARARREMRLQLEREQDQKEAMQAEHQEMKRIHEQLQNLVHAKHSLISARSMGAAEQQKLWEDYASQLSRVQSTSSVQNAAASPGVAFSEPITPADRSPRMRPVHRYRRRAPDGEKSLRNTLLKDVSRSGSKTAVPI